MEEDIKRTNELCHALGRVMGMLVSRDIQEILISKGISPEQIRTLEAQIKEIALLACYRKMEKE